VGLVNDADVTGASKFVSNYTENDGMSMLQVGKNDIG